MKADDTLIAELADARCDHDRRVFDATKLLLADTLEPAEFVEWVKESGRQLMLTTLRLTTQEKISA